MSLPELISAQSALAAVDAVPEELESASGPWALVLGASAGGLEALRQLVPKLPLHDQLLVVVAMHVSPTHKSLLSELLARETRAPVMEITQGMPARPGRIYVVPSASHLRIANERFLLEETTTSGVPKPCIDIVCQSFAEAYGERTVAVVLSGTGSDGSRGVRVVRSKGGFVIAQEPAEARYDSMPLRAIDSGAVHHVCPAAEIPAVIERLLSYTWRPPGVDTAATGESAALADAARVVRLGTGFELAAYKESTLRRRLDRRMRARACHAMGEYVALLDREPAEQKKLIEELLISVTGFFRDPEVFASLEDSLFALCRRAAEEDRELRIWVAGCATGEEAYSLALMLTAIEERGGQPHRAKIFATDIDVSALELARNAVYASAALDDIPQAWRHAALTIDGEVFRVGNRVRDVVLFSEHNVLRDPPFLRIDLICCRNLLIYLTPRWQQWVLQQFQLSLAGGRLLLLGKNENLAASSGFERVGNDSQGLYRCVERRREPGWRRAPANPPRRQDALAPAPKSAGGASGPAELLLAAHTTGMLAPALAMSDEGTLLHTFGDLSSFLSFSTGGQATLELAQLCSPAVGLELRALGYRARAEAGKPVSSSFVPAPGEAPLLVTALRLPGKSVTLVAFQGGRLAGEAQPCAEDGAVPAVREHGSFTQAHLQTLVSELDTANEDLQLLNEELQSANEELQSTNEELETANEELQSTNEELLTVNEELQVRTSEVAMRNTDLNNVKNSLVDPLLVVDEHARLILRNPGAERLWRFNGTSLPNERPLLASIPTELPMLEVMEALASVLSGGPVIDRELNARDDSVYAMRIQPYLTAGGECRGAVLVFRDTTEATRLRRQLQSTADELAASEAFRRAVVDALPEQICVIGEEGRITAINAAWRTSVSASDLKWSGVGSDYLATCERAAARGDTLAADFYEGLCAVRRRALARFEQDYPCTNDQGPRWFRATVTPFASTGSSVVVRHEDITVHRREAELRRSNADLEQFALVASHDLQEPLRMITSYTQLLAQSYQGVLDEKADKYIHYVVDGGERMQKMIADLLAYARIGSRGRALAPVSAQTALEEVQASVQRIVAESRATIIVAEPLPQVLADSTQLNQIFSNLIVNALKFRRSEPPRIEITAQALGPSWQFAVADNGIGFEMAHHDRIFQLFARLNPRDAFEGTGIGLAIVKRIVERHGGTIRAESRLGQGTTFFFTLQAVFT